MSTPTFIDLFENVLDLSTCEEIIRRFEADEKSHFAGVVGNGDGTTRIDDTLKVCRELHVTRTAGWEDIDEILFKSLTQVTQSLREKYPTFGHTGMCDEGYRIKRYLPNGIDRFDPHVDTGSAYNSHRQMVLMWYLNDVHKGGETSFPYHGFEISPRAGTMVTFPPFWTHQHAGRVPVSGPKYIIVGWLTFPMIPSAERVAVPINYK